MNNKNLTIYFNKKYDFQDSGIKVFMYHVTDSRLKNKILKDGLISKSKKKIENVSVVINGDITYLKDIYYSENCLLRKQKIKMILR